MRQFKNMFITPLYRQHVSHTLASRAYGPQPHMRSSPTAQDHTEETSELYQGISTVDLSAPRGWFGRRQYSTAMSTLLKGTILKIPSAWPQAVEVREGPAVVCRAGQRGVVRDSNSGHLLLLPPANLCPMFASRTTQVDDAEARRRVDRPTDRTHPPPPAAPALCSLCSCLLLGRSLLPFARSDPIRCSVHAADRWVLCAARRGRCSAS